MLNGFYLRGVMGFAVGLPFGVLGVVWLVLREKFGPQVQELVRTAVLDMRIWMIGLVLLFFWISVPTIRTDHQLLVSIVEEVREIKKGMNRYVLPRHLTDQQSKEISDYLLHYDPKELTIVFALNNEEASEYELDFEHAFTRGGWTVHRNPTDKFPDGTSLPEGLSTYFRGEPTQKVKHDDKHPGADSLLGDALQQANIEPESSSQGGADNGIGTYTLCLGINHRRMDDGPIQAKKQAIEQLRKMVNEPD